MYPKQFTAYVTNPYITFKLVHLAEADMCGLIAEAMSSTIETNIREMVEINGGIRKLVQRVSKESIATAGNNGSGSNGNGSGRYENEFAGAVEEEI